MSPTKGKLCTLTFHSVLSSLFYLQFLLIQSYYVKNALSKSSDPNKKRQITSNVGLLETQPPRNYIKHSLLEKSLVPS